VYGAEHVSGQAVRRRIERRLKIGGEAARARDRRCRSRPGDRAAR
jgi:hypothetical protein